VLLREPLGHGQSQHDRQHCREAPILMEQSQKSGHGRLPCHRGFPMTVVTGLEN
jgi:hypothetical protein